jgi:hypothetical protein
VTLDEAQHGGGEDVCCLGRLAGGAGQCVHPGIIGGVDVRVAIDYVKFLCHCCNFTDCRLHCQEAKAANPNPSTLLRTGI